jgi:hypothetical protein
MHPTAIMVVVPNNKGDQYSTVKKKTYVEYATPSQVMTGNVLKKFTKDMRPLATKVAIQMAAKLGGEPWAINCPLPNTMIAGYDTFHDTVNKKKSVGAFVASLNRFISR